jgi:hypothetical protein
LAGIKKSIFDDGSLTIQAKELILEDKNSNSLAGKHSPKAPHIHLETFKPNNIKDPYTNNHVFF